MFDFGRANDFALHIERHRVGGGVWQQNVFWCRQAPGFINNHLRRDGFGDEYAYQWLKLMKIDRKTIHRALIQVYGDMDKIIKSPDSNKGHCQFAEVGKNRILMFMSFCADENDKEWLNGVYADKGETNEIRVNAFFVLLMMSGRDDVTSLILSVANFIDQPAKIRSFMYSGIKAAASWAPVEKRTGLRPGGAGGGRGRDFDD